MTLRAVAGVLAACLVCAMPADAQRASPGNLLDRAAAYVRQFVNEFSNVVAEEDLRQEWQTGERRRLKSDFLLVRYPGTETAWLSFRDVFEVNGTPVRDQQDRLTKLFLEPFADAVRRAEDITRAASRHSLVELGALSNPLIILAYLQPFYQPQFTFRLGGIDSKLGPRVRSLELEELVAPTPTDPGSRHPPLRGVAWIDEDTGRVVKTELRFGVAPNTTIATTTFRFDDTLGINVPAEMRESRVGRSTAAAQGRFPAVARDQFTGVATYGRFRRFQVRTEEDIEKPVVR
jgi:hypothetical protein